MPEIDWTAWLRRGDRVVCSHMSAEPVVLLADLAARGPDLPLELMLGVPFSADIAAAPAAWRIVTYGGMGSAAAIAARRGDVDISPLPYGRSGAVYREGLWRCDVALLSLARAADGQLYLGASHGPALEAARRARAVIAEVNARAPCIEGGPWPEGMRIDALIEVERDLAAPPAPAPSAAEATIAAHIAERVPDGACLQVGIGALPSAVLAALASHRHLGIHTGIMTDALLDLWQRGAVDHSRKTVDSGVAVVGAVHGGTALHRFAHANPALRLREPGYTHDPAVVCALADFWAVNSALEVSLLGEVNAETVTDEQGRWRHVGGVGGLPDFARAAQSAPRGHSVIALASRTPRGRPRVVARLGGPATLAAADADLVVTEHGVADLRDVHVRERVRRMIAVAHPGDREPLLSQARGLGLA